MRYFFKHYLFILFFIVCFIFPNQVLSGTVRARGYHNYQDLTAALKQLANQNKSLVKMTSIGKTNQKKELWMLQISGPKGGSPLHKQALLICGNAEGDHLIGSEVALGIAEFLVKAYGKDKSVTEILDKRTLYIIPRLNPDGAEIFFNKVLQEHSGNLRPRDDDYDWKVDEDGPEDLNGDGLITLMRVKDKKGDWLIDKKDSRLMKKKETGTPLDKLYKIYPEGIDNDGDEQYNEDGPGGFNINRNFPHNFGYKAKGWGVYPVSELETRALIDFMTRYVPQFKTQPHKNICAILLFSQYDNLAGSPGIEGGRPTFPQPRVAAPTRPQRSMFRFSRGQRGQQAPTSAPRDPQPKKNNAADTPIFKQVSDEYKKITGIKSALTKKPVGSLLEWGYFQFGVPTFSANLWSLRTTRPDRPAIRPGGAQRQPQAQGQQSDMRARMMMMQRGGTTRRGSTGTPADTSNDEKWLKWIDKENKGKGFVKWKKFTHPQLGEVEIGGFEPHLRINPPVKQVAELSKKHAKFAIYLAAQFAEINMSNPQVNRMSSNLYQVKVTLANNGKLPYATAMGQRTRNVTPIMLTIKFANNKEMKLFGGKKRFDIANLAPGEEKEFKWIIISPPGKRATLTLWARFGGGKLAKKILLK